LLRIFSHLPRFLVHLAELRSQNPLFFFLSHFLLRLLA